MPTVTNLFRMVVCRSVPLGTMRTSLILTVRGPSANRPECHQPLGRSRSTGGGHPLSGTRETWAAPFAPRKVLHDVASPAPNRKRPCLTNRDFSLISTEFEMTGHTNPTRQRGTNFLRKMEQGGAAGLATRAST